MCCSHEAVMLIGSGLMAGSGSRLSIILAVRLQVLGLLMLPLDTKVTEALDFGWISLWLMVTSGSIPAVVI